MLRFYFGGREAEADGGFTFGLAPTERALDAYLELLGDCPLPWSVTVVGGDLFATDLPELALARGGHLRVGLEDHRGRPATNEELVAQAVDAVQASGRQVADCTTAAAFLGLKPASRVPGRTWREGDTVRARRTPGGGPPCTSTT